MNSLEQLIQRLEERGTMYMGWMTIERFGGFLNGWLIGKGGSVQKEGSEILREFREFLCKRFDLPNRYDWESMLILVSQDKNHDLKMFFRLFREFLDNRNRDNVQDT